MKFFELFELDMQSVLMDEIDKSFALLEPTPLCDTSIDELKQYELANPKIKKGLYVLYHQGLESYFGKTDNKLSERLADHLKKISARKNISIADMAFKCVYFDKNWSALSHEQPLIQKAQNEGKCEWNNKGFGNHDPGRQRDSTQVADDRFDKRYPINPDHATTLSLSGTYPVLTILPLLKANLPYLFRYENVGSTEAVVDIRQGETIKSLLGKIVDALGADWQVTFLFGYVIMYKEHGAYPAQCHKTGGQDWVE